MLPFAIVEFVTSKSVAIVPCQWLTNSEEDKCYWPSVNSAKIGKLVQQCIEPSEKWTVYDVRVLGKAANYERAKEKLRMAEETSDIQTDIEEHIRKKRRTHKYIDSDSDEELERPDSPFSTRQLSSSPVLLNAPTPPPQNPSSPPPLPCRSLPSTSSPPASSSSPESPPSPTSPNSISRSPATQSSSARSPATQSSSARSPATQSSSTRSPATQSPSARSPATQSSSARSLAIQSSSARSLATQSSFARSPATQSSSARSPATQSSFARSPATQSSSARSPATQSSFARSPATQSSSARSLATQSSSARSLATQSSSARSPATQSSFARSPATQSSFARSPATQSSSARSPATQSSSARSPATQSSFARSPATQSSSARSLATQSSSARSPAASGSRGPTMASRSPSTSLAHRSVPVLTQSSECGENMNMQSALIRILKVLEEIKQNQAIQGAVLNTLQKQSGAVIPDTSLPEEVSFPLTSMEDFDSLESYLKEPAFQNKLILILRDIGGRTLDETVKRVMGFLMTTKVALDFNFIGRNKRAFGKSGLHEVVYRSLKRNTATASNNRQEVGSAIGKWLTGARDRDGRRTGRVQQERERRAQREQRQ